MQTSVHDRRILKHSLWFHPPACAYFIIISNIIVDITHSKPPQGIERYENYKIARFNSQRLLQS